jgi:chemotaxis protein MotB
MIGPRKRRKESEEGGGGAPEWMVTFSDCMTLLLTFFVLLLSFSSFDENIFRKLRIIFCTALPSVSSAMRKDKDSFLLRGQIEPTPELAEGSEKPTLLRGRDNNLKEDREPAEFRQRKVFLIQSKKVFWGRGTLISAEGRALMAKMASYLEEVPDRIVISENGPDARGAEQDLGLKRAWTILEHLTTRRGLEKARFSLATASMVMGGGDAEREGERMVEIVLLERSICN